MRDSDLQKGETYRDTSRSRQSRVVLDEIEPSKDATYIVGAYVALTQRWEQARKSITFPRPVRCPLDEHIFQQPGSEAFNRTEISDF